MPAICRDCDAEVPGVVCGVCGGARVVRHVGLFELAIGHVDCDAFYASVEKRDRPELRDLPVIVGGGTRGVVATCCYVARLMACAAPCRCSRRWRLCPKAVVIRPDMAKYVAVSREVRALMEDLTPLVQPLSIDEAVLDLSGTEALHGAPPAVVLNRFARRVEAELGRDRLHRPGAQPAAGQARGRARQAARLFRARRGGGGRAGAGAGGPAARHRPGAGQAAAHARHLPHRPVGGAGRRGPPGRNSARRARRWRPAPAARIRARVHLERETKSISAETTFSTDLTRLADLEAELWRLCEKLGRRLRAESLAAAGIVLKLKTAAFAGRTRSQRLPNPTQLPETLFEAGRKLLAREAGRHRLPPDRHRRRPAGARASRRQGRSGGRPIRPPRGPADRDRPPARPLRPERRAAWPRLAEIPIAQVGYPHEHEHGNTSPLTAKAFARPCPASALR